MNVDTVEDVSRPVRTPYHFQPAFAADHFVSEYITFFAQQCDAAFEYFEATGLLALALATHGLKVRLSGAGEPLRTNLYLAFVGDSTSSRKTTTKEYLLVVAKALPQLCAVLPDMGSHEGTLEALGDSSGLSALWAIDELKPQLERITHAKHLAGMQGMLLELYGSTSHAYKRSSKRRKTKDGNSELITDELRVEDVTFSILGLTTPAIFERLTTEAVTSGLLARFGIVWPTGKPARIPRYQIDEQHGHPSSLIRRLHDMAARIATCRVHFEADALTLIDREVELIIEQTDSPMLKRMGTMAQKVALLSAAGRPGVLHENTLRITLDDARSAITVVQRWMDGSRRFEARIGESEFERNAERCLAIVRGRTGYVARREIARRVHVEARTLKEIESTLRDRGQIEVKVQQGATGAPGYLWKWLT